MRKVFVATPCYDGRIDVWYANSLFQTQKLAAEHQVEITPIWMSYDALVQRARNDLIAMALETGHDDIIFIDHDIEWEPQWFYQLLNYPVDVVGGTYRRKSDSEISYVAKINDPLSVVPDPVTGLLPVAGLGTGFMRISRQAMTALWDSSRPYTETDKNKHRRWIFDVIVDEHGELVSEDITVCNKLKQLGFDLWLASHMTCNHVGNKKYTGNFATWFSEMTARAPTPPAVKQSPSVRSLYL